MNRAPHNMPIILQTKSICRSVCASVLLVAAMSSTAIAEVSLELALDQERVYTGEAVPVTVILRIGDEADVGVLKAVEERQTYYTAAEPVGIWKFRT